MPVLLVSFLQDIWCFRNRSKRSRHGPGRRQPRASAGRDIRAPSGGQGEAERDVVTLPPRALVPLCVFSPFPPRSYFYRHVSQFWCERDRQTRGWQAAGFSPQTRVSYGQKAHGLFGDGQGAWQGPALPECRGTRHGCSCILLLVPQGQPRG